MKRITFLAWMLMTFYGQVFAQVQVGTDTSTTSLYPISSCYGYTYSQQIYLASEIDAIGSITELSFYLDAQTSTSDFSDSTDWTIYIGHTMKAAFEDTDDWEALANLSTVYTGTLSFPEEDNWVTITLDTPFDYNGADNLIVAIDENLTEYDCTMFWHKTDRSDSRGLYYRNDDTNPDPASPPTATGISSFTNNVIFEGLLPNNIPNCDAILSAPVNEATNVDLSVILEWAIATGSPTGYKINIGTSSGATDIADNIDVGNVTQYDAGTLMADQTYFVTIIPYNSQGEAISCTEESFTTLSAPSCVSNPMATPDTSCGNYDVPLTWDTESIADGYYLTIGTTPGGNDIADAIDLETNSYTLTAPSLDTSYYWTVVPYNSVGSPTGCSENMFSTIAAGCYCDSTPTSNDDDGITNVNFQGIDFATDDVTYFDHSGTVIDMQQSMSAQLNIDFATGYTYDTNIWIDLNDNYVYEPSELFFDGESTSDNPTTLNASFIIPVDATLGEHAMRIGTADSGQSTPNPCYSGSYGVTLDFRVNITEAPSCLPPTGIMMANITDTNVSILWTAGASETDWEYVVQIAGTGEPVSGTAVSGSPSISEASLMSLTDYEIYIRSICGGDNSPWVGPLNFTTLCAPYTATYTQNFDAETAPELNTCWSTSLTESTSTYANIQSSTTQSISASNSIRFYNSSDTSGTYLLISPMFTDLDDTKRIQFQVYMNVGDDDDTFEVGTMSDPTDPSTYTTYESFTTVDFTEDDWTSITVNFDTYSGSDSYVVLKYNPAGSYNYWYIDDFVYEPIPSCLEPSNLTASATSFTEAIISWDAGGSETTWEYVIQAAGTGNPTSGTSTSNMTESIEGLIENSNYEVYVRANCDGDYSPWVGPVNFTTFYCESIPSSNDNNGITNVNFQGTDFTTEDVTYFDHTGVPIEINQSTTAQLSIDFATGYTYDTNIWIDLNDNMEFEASELLFQGESENSNPTTLDASFVVPVDAMLGVHYMRIGTADSGQSTPDPCYSGSYGVTLDFKVNIVETLAIEGFDHESAFTYFPNPVNDKLLLRAQNKIQYIAVYNMLGQEVLRNIPEISTKNLDMSALEAGAYFVQVTINDKTKTIKIVRK